MRRRHPECLRRNQSSRLLRIWSAGCSIGPEAYTLEILLRRTFAEQLAGWQVHILGTDINGAFIEQARRATYGDWALRGLSPDIQEAAFDHRGKQWTVKPEFRQWTSFMVFNLVDGAIPSYPRGIGHFDIILCRNVMIYFDEATRRRLLGDLHAALNDGGWLVVGHAEAGPQLNELFSPVPVPGATLYRRQLRPAPPQPAVPPPPRPPRFVRPAAPAPAAASTAAPAPAPPPAKPAARKAPRRDDEGGRGSALEAALAEVERSRMDPAAHYRLGLLEEDLGVGDPVAAFKRALYLDPGFVLADYHLALAYWRRGKLAAAQRHFRNARDAMAGRSDDDPVAEGGGLTVRELHGMVELWLSGEEAS
ncbi:CheR family methyltransferase [Azospirillum thermophilum]|uniref:CheR family methyltransferase n=1 Tax=Azospirillum thermophilum TaxID=2202148 RepID=UPI001FE78A22|nr:CheR family methyltransferase [Azospirillum thermophilum]